MTYCEVQKAPKARFDRRSFRWVRSGRGRVLIGCPIGKWQARKKRCKVGTRAYKVLTPARGRCHGRRVT